MLDLLRTRMTTFIKAKMLNKNVGQTTLTLAVCRNLKSKISKTCLSLNNIVFKFDAKFRIMFKVIFKLLHLIVIVIND